MRTRLPSIKDVAEQVLDSVRSERLVKHAGAQFQTDENLLPQSELSRELLKIAAACRVSDDSLTYNDIDQFVRAVNAK